MVVLAGCDDRTRRWFTGLCPTEAAACEGDGVCIQGHCARPCVSSDECGDGLCFQNHCVPPEYACTHGFCDDGNQCSDDACNVLTAQCRHDPHLGPCNDGDKCTIGDECVGLACKHAPKCDDGDPTTADKCDAATGACTHN